MTDEARAKAVEAAEDAFYVAVGLNGVGRSVAGKAAFGAAITAYLATMADAGWVMVPRSLPETDANKPGVWLAYETFAEADACRAAMLKGSTDGQG